MGEHGRIWPDVRMKIGKEWYIKLVRDCVRIVMSCSWFYLFEREYRMEVCKKCMNITYNFIHGCIANRYREIGQNKAV